MPLLLLLRSLCSIELLLYMSFRYEEFRSLGLGLLQYVTVRNDLHLLPCCHCQRRAHPANRAVEPHAGTRYVDPTTMAYNASWNRSLNQVLTAASPLLIDDILGTLLQMPEITRGCGCGRHRGDQ